MSPKKNKQAGNEPDNIANELSFFDDIKDEGGAFPPEKTAKGKKKEPLPDFKDETNADNAPADMSSKSAKKTPLPDFKEESDRSAVLPEKDDIMPEDGKKPQGKKDKRKDKSKSKNPENDASGKPETSDIKQTIGSDDEQDKKKADKKQKNIGDFDEDLLREAIGPEALKKYKKTSKKKAAAKKAEETRLAESAKDIELIEGVKPVKGNKLSKFIFILSMCLISPFAVILLFSIILLFALIITAAILVAGALALALVALVVAGVILALTGVIYGVFQMITKEGFSFYAGMYELGLGLAITGITTVLSSLIYSGASTLVPFVSKQIGRLFKFIARKVKAMIVRIYKYSTSL